MFSMFKCVGQEVRSIVKARKLGVHTPVVYYVEFGANVIYMEKVVGTSVKELLQTGKLSDEGMVHPVSLPALYPCPPCILARSLPSSARRMPLSFSFLLFFFGGGGGWQSGRDVAMFLLS